MNQFLAEFYEPSLHLSSVNSTLSFLSKPFLRIWSRLLKKSVMENLGVCGRLFFYEMRSDFPLALKFMQAMACDVVFMYI